MESDEEIEGTTIETGSDELLADDNLRLPESASILVRLHAVRAWLTRRYEETALEMGEATLTLQQVDRQACPETRLRRRERLEIQARRERLQQALSEVRQRLDAYEEAQLLLEDFVAHSGGERVLVEYYLALDDLLQAVSQDSEPQQERQRALTDVQHRVEHVGAPGPED